MKEKCTHTILIVSTVKSSNFILQTVTIAPFRRSVPAISYLLMFGFNPEKCKNVWEIFKRFLTDAMSLTKKVKSSAYVVNKKIIESFSAFN